MEDPKHRHIRSFVLRQGHFSEAQTRAVEAGLPLWGIEYRPELIDLDTAFGRTAPKVLEIGFGMGGATADIAAARPDTDFLGIEVHGPGVGNLLKLIEEKQLTNIRVMRHDAVEVLEHMLAENSLDGFHLYFPDPWPKKRHHKRRLVQPEFLERIVKRLKPGAYIHMATDWEDYAVQMLEVLSANAQLQNTAQTYAERPAWRPLTKFEQRGLNLGHGVWDLIFVKRAV
ncbi:tRNA (guanosine(46)-N7)-methyltransferase TrmB [Chitinimonas sp. PSY-7]|uniref:tRNA (guanosine(46)-N7)-methyltransferase TrmB n=1 Tax=Chitinimonas sp. PSY-7 TaxID=3459088 RepID=UPI0040401F9A